MAQGGGRYGAGLGGGCPDPTRIRNCDQDAGAVRRRPCLDGARDAGDEPRGVIARVEALVECRYFRVAVFAGMAIHALLPVQRPGKPFTAECSGKKGAEGCCHGCGQGDDCSEGSGSPGKSGGVGGAVHAGELAGTGCGQQGDDDHKCDGQKDDGDGHGKLPIHGGVLTC